MIGRINCQAAITSFCKLNAHGSFTHQNIFFSRHDFHPKRADGLEWLKHNDMVCCVCLGLFPVDSMRLQKFNGWIVANVCKTYGNVVSTFEWTFALWDLNDIVYSRSCVFCATFCFGQGSRCSLSKRLQHKKKQSIVYPGIFSHALPPPLWLKGMTGLKVLAATKTMKNTLLLRTH